MSFNKTEIENCLRAYIDPYLKQDLLSAKAIKHIAIDNDQVIINIVLGYPAQHYRDTLIAALKEKLSTHTNVSNIHINVSWEIVSHAVQTGIKTLTQVKNIIAVASGKGGVGKSTTTVNLALALAAEGARVGILDADIYGPNQPHMLGAIQKPESKDGKSLEPVIAHGIQSMSIGYLIDIDTPMIWRGPMVTGALQQLLNDTKWQDLDYLFIDLPPGTGDIQLTLSQKIPVSGAVIVTTPQDVALLDARKAIAMFEKVKVPVLGIVENMSMHICSECGHAEPIFGEGGGERIAEQYHVELLGKLPLDIRIREQADSGTPIVLAESKSSIATNYFNIARFVAAKLSLQAKSYVSKFPNIVIENR